MGQVPGLPQLYWQVREAEHACMLRLARLAHVMTGLGVACMHLWLAKVLGKGAASFYFLVD